MPVAADPPSDSAVHKRDSRSPGELVHGYVDRLWSWLKAVPWLWQLIVGIGRYVGATPQNMMLLKTMSRPWWLYGSKRRLTLCRVERREPLMVTSADVALCERLIAAFRVATGRDEERWETRGLWALLFDVYQRKLAETLARGDAHELAQLLAAMFQEDFTHGLLLHAHASNSESWLGSRISSLRWLDMLVSLAEALGVIPVEGPEQRRAGVVFNGDLAELLGRIEQALGFELDFPDVGAPFGSMVNGRLITMETPELVYATTRLDRAVRVHLSQIEPDDLAIVEIGGGYGGMCYWYLRARPDLGRYTIVDLPIMNVLQGYFLARALGGLGVSFCGEPHARVHILPNSALAEIPDPVQVLVNKDSMPEMPYDAMIDYLEWGRSNCAGFFYSYNHEVGTKVRGSPAGQVPEAVRKVGGFTQISRDHSWLRRGYAEEIYLSATHERRATR
jgi:hypothetical protein